MNNARLERACKKQKNWAWFHYTPVSFVRASDGALFVQEFEQITYHMQ